MKTWDWWVPWVFSAATFAIQHLLTRRSQSFKELTEVKNAYKMRVEEVEKKLEKLTPKVRKLEDDVSKFKGYHESCQKALEFSNKRVEELMKFFKDHVSGRNPNGLEADGPIS